MKPFNVEIPGYRPLLVGLTKEDGHQAVWWTDKQGMRQCSYVDGLTFAALQQIDRLNTQVRLARDGVTRMYGERDRERKKVRTLRLTLRFIRNADAESVKGLIDHALYLTDDRRKKRRRR